MVTDTSLYHNGNPEIVVDTMAASVLTKTGPEPRNRQERRAKDGFSTSEWDSLLRRAEDNLGPRHEATHSDKWDQDFWALVFGRKLNQRRR